jgi:hypothetical protein
MHECIIVYRDEGGEIGVVVHHFDRSIIVFDDLDAAVAYCDKGDKPFKPYSGIEHRRIEHYQIVELDEL